MLAAPKAPANWKLSAKPAQAVRDILRRVPVALPQPVAAFHPLPLPAAAPAPQAAAAPLAPPVVALAVPDPNLVVVPAHDAAPESAAALGGASRARALRKAPKVCLCGKKVEYGAVGCDAKRQLPAWWLAAPQVRGSNGGRGEKACALFMSVVQMRSESFISH